MDLGDPTRSITSALDGPVLAALAAAGAPMTVVEVAAQSARGSEIGVRKSLARLVEQGIVGVNELGRTRAYALNRDHIAAPIADQLAGLRNTLWRRLRDELKAWKPRPLNARVFGSAARGDGDVDSDIDLLVIRSPFPGERDERLSKGQGVQRLAGVASQAFTQQMTRREVDRWTENSERLREHAFGWTGNRLQIVDVSLFEWQRHTRRKSPLWREIQRDGIEVLPTPSDVALTFREVLGIK
jgi:predicted nucleotidyltransferase